MHARLDMYGGISDLPMPKNIDIRADCGDQILSIAESNLLLLRKDSIRDEALDVDVVPQST